MPAPKSTGAYVKTSRWSYENLEKYAAPSMPTGCLTGTRKDAFGWPVNFPQGQPEPGQRFARGRHRRDADFVIEATRYLVAGDDRTVCNIEQQRHFFRVHVQPGCRLR